MQIRVSSVSEKDIDLLLVEEFASSTDFADWFLGQVYVSKNDVTWVITEVGRSISDSTGESDLQVVYSSEEGKKHCILIENKISASFQPKQAERYQQRARNLISKWDFSSAATVLVAPQSYLGHEETHKGFHNTVSYEQIMEWVNSSENLGARANYKQALLKAAIEKAAHGYQPEEDAHVTRFWMRYGELSHLVTPELALPEESGRPSGSGFIYFRNADILGRAQLVHKMERGVVDLQFHNMAGRLAQLRQEFGDRLENDMQITNANKSGVIRLKVPVIKPTESFDSQMAAVAQCLRSAKRLLKWYASV